MKIKIHDEKKYVSFWLTKEEKEKPEVWKSLKNEFSKWKAKKYEVVIFESGNENLIELTASLLKSELERRKTP